MCFWTGDGMWSKLWMVLLLLLFSKIFLKSKMPCEMHFHIKTTLSLSLWEKLWVCSKRTNQKAFENCFWFSFLSPFWYITRIFNYSINVWWIKIQFHQELLKIAEAKWVVNGFSCWFHVYKGQNKPLLYNFCHFCSVWW